MNPFPRGAGRSIIECYKAQVPVVVMNPPADIWLRKPYLVHNKVPTIYTELGSAKDEDDYLRLVNSILNDALFGNSMIHEQNELYTKLTDPQHIWDLILDNIPNKTPSNFDK